MHIISYYLSTQGRINSKGSDAEEGGGGKWIQFKEMGQFIQC